MGYSFKDNVIKNLPAGSTYVRMYAISTSKTIVEVIKGGKTVHFTMDKINLSTLFTRIPVITISSSATYNDLYARISDVYSLGFTKGVDFFNGELVNPTSSMRYIELPVMNDSYGYFGAIRCRVVLSGYDIPINEVNKDFTETGNLGAFDFIKFKTLVMTRIYTLSTPMFIGDKITLEFTNLILSKMTDHFDDEFIKKAEENLLYSTVVMVVNDGLSDIVILRLKDNLDLFIRFKSNLSDLPVFDGSEIIINTTSDVETGASEEVSVGDSDSTSENPVGEEGENNVTEETVIEDTVDDHPNSSVDSSELTIENNDEEIDLNIE